jgi:glutamyl-Q tRNA(Asp) synthetase
MANHGHPQYVGRFAPSPTGPLHFGSLLAAVASYLQAKSCNGRWLVRMEDIDPPREVPGADRLILRALETYGFAWDGPVLYQSRQVEWHRQLVDRLVAEGFAYPCGCSRSDLAGAARGPLGVIYPGTCRNGSTASRTAIRVRTHDEPVGYRDLLQGPQSQRLEPESGDFVIRRRDGLIAYQLAVAADDAAEGVSQVVRGIDLMDSTPRQIHLQRLLELPTPEYAHIPVAVNARGQKLSKTTGARALPLDEPRPVLIRALQALGQPAPAGLAGARLDALWAWALEHWDMSVLARRREITGPLAAAENGLS